MDMMSHPGYLMMSP